MKTEISRIAVYSADLPRITGRSERTCQRILREIRDLFGLKKRQHVTICQASEYLGIPVSKMSPFIR